MTKAKTKQASSVRLSIERGLEPHRNRVHTITVLELLKNEKTTVVYFAPRKEFFNIKTSYDVQELLRLCEPQASKSLHNSNSLRRQMESLSLGKQSSLNL